MNGNKRARTNIIYYGQQFCNRARTRKKCAKIDYSSLLLWLKAARNAIMLNGVLSDKNPGRK
jgi:hypothetical protein